MTNDHKLYCMKILYGQTHKFSSNLYNQLFFLDFVCGVGYDPPSPPPILHSVDFSTLINIALLCLNKCGCIVSHPSIHPYFLSIVTKFYTCIAKLLMNVWVTPGASHSVPAWVLLLYVSILQ